MMKSKIFPLRCYGCLALLAAIQFGCPAPAWVAADVPPTTPPRWERRYKEGEKIVYHMRATNRDRSGTWIYEFVANGVVKKDPEGKFYEEFTWTNVVSDKLTSKIDLFSIPSKSAWSNLVAGKKGLVLPESSLNFRQRLALPGVPEASDFMMMFTGMGELPKVHPAMRGPIADLTTFYVDLMFSARFGGQAKAGDHRYIDTGGRANSWADGQHVVLGADSFDFDCTVKEIDRTHQTATLVINHVPSKKSQIVLPAEWMRDPVAGTSNNWAQVEKNDDGTYTAGVGKETFEVQIRLSLVDGRILSARMDNPVDVLERKCTDAALTKPGIPTHYQIRRQIELY